jgi:hypothetical protein
MLRPGPWQLRGRIRWQWRRWRRDLRRGTAERRRLPVVVGNAIPKSGSKLLFNILRGLQDLDAFVDTGLNEIKPYRGGKATPQAWINAELDSLRPGDLRFGYLPWHPETEARLCRAGWAVYLILRDPRDTIVSQIFYATQMHPGHALHRYLLSLPDMEARIETMIRGIPDGPLQRVGIREQYDRFLPWLSRPAVCAVRYERLVEDPDDVLRAMLGYLGGRGFAPREPEAALVPRLRERMAPEKSETFRKGGAGGWKQHFTDRNREQFNAATGDLLQVLGYEG